MSPTRPLLLTRRRTLSAWALAGVSVFAVLALAWVYLGSAREAVSPTSPDRADPTGTSSAMGLIVTPRHPNAEPSPHGGLTPSQTRERLFRHGSLSGTTPTGDWCVRGTRLQPCEALRHRFEYYLLAQGEVEAADLRALVADELTRAHGPAPVAEVLALWGRYATLRAHPYRTVFDPRNLTTWRAPEILKDNPRIAAAIPDVPVTVAYRSDASGTSKNTLQYLNAWAPSIWAKVQDDFGTAFPGGRPPANSVAGKGNPAVLSLVAGKEGTIGYVDYGDAKGYPSARIANALGEFVAPSPASASKNLGSQTNIATNGLVTLNYQTKVSGAYPVAIFSYMLARTDGKGPNGLGVRKFADYVLQKCGPSRAAGLGYVPVTGQVLTKAKALVLRIQ